MTRWQDLYDEKRGRVIQEAGYLVRLYSPSNLRYLEGDRSLTLITDIVDDSERRGRKWLIFPNVRVIVYVPSSMTWDNGTPIAPPAAEMVVQRIQRAIEKAGEVYAMETSDEVYEKAQRDWEMFGPNRTGKSSL